MAYFYNYLTVCLLAYFVDPGTLILPQMTLLMAQIATTYLLEDTTTYVPTAIRNILAFWYVFMQLAYPIQIAYGMAIGIA